MKRLLALLLTIFNTITAQDYELSICTIFRDDAIYLPEWIDFHLSQGVQHFYLYDNLSSDRPDLILKPYIDNGSVTLTSWPFSSTKDTWNSIQCNAFMHCIKNNGHKSKWIAFIDTDEFLFSPSKQSLPVVLLDYEMFGAVGVNWVLYGTSWIDKLDQNKRMLDQLTWRGENHPYHTTIKSLIQPRCLSNFTSPHFGNLKKGYCCVDENRQLIPSYHSEYPSVNILRINHYWTRDRHFLMTEKNRRAIEWGGKPIDLEHTESILNQVDDPILKSSIFP